MLRLALDDSSLLEGVGAEEVESVGETVLPVEDESVVCHLGPPVGQQSSSYTKTNHISLDLPRKPHTDVGVA